MKIFCSSFVFLLLCSIGLQAEEAVSSDVPVAETVPPVETVVGTSSYDAEAIQELYEKYKKQNEARAKAEGSPLIGGMETFELDDFEVFDDDVGYNTRELMEKMSPKPRNRINRIARVNPDAAAEIQHALRSDEVFFSKESLSEVGSSGTGQTADFTAKQIVEALGKIGSLFGGKKEEPPEDVR